APPLKPLGLVAGQHRQGGLRLEKAAIAIAERTFSINHRQSKIERLALPEAHNVVSPHPGSRKREPNLPTLTRLRLPKACRLLSADTDRASPMLPPKRHLVKIGRASLHLACAKAAHAVRQEAT